MFTEAKVHRTQEDSDRSDSIREIVDAENAFFAERELELQAIEAQLEADNWVTSRKTQHEFDSWVSPRKTQNEVDNCFSTRRHL